jgi:hypothetical protein
MLGWNIDGARYDTLVGTGIREETATRNGERWISYASSLIRIENTGAIQYSYT